MRISQREQAYSLDEPLRRYQAERPERGNAAAPYAVRRLGSLRKPACKPDNDVWHHLDRVVPVSCRLKRCRDACRPSAGKC